MNRLKVVGRQPLGREPLHQAPRRPIPGWLALLKGGGAIAFFPLFVVYTFARGGHGRRELLEGGWAVQAFGLGACALFWSLALVVSAPLRGGPSVLSPPVNDPSPSHEAARDRATQQALISSGMSRADATAATQGISRACADGQMSGC
jgi:hypothetical protein